MRNRRLPLLLACAALALTGPGPGQAAELQGELTAQVQRSLTATTPLTLPEQAARLVRRAAARDRTVTAVATVNYALTRHPNAALATLRAVVAAAPDQAPEITVAAVKLAPKRFKELVAAGAVGAPGSARRLVVALCREFPLQLDQVAALVVQEVPSAAPSVLAAIGEALPGTPKLLEHNATRVRSLGRHDVQVIVPATALTLQQVNASARTIASAIDNPNVNFADVAIAILLGNITLNASGYIESINASAITNPNLNSALSTPEARTTVTTAVQTMRDDSGSSYNQVWTTPVSTPDIIPAGATIVVSETEVRPYSQ